MTKTYGDLIRIPKFEDRFEYLKLNGVVGDMTFAGSRRLNQMLYKDPRWRSVRNQVIVRDKGCDLAHPDYDLADQAAYVHHINPITIEDILEERPLIFDPNNLITVSFLTHQAIHYSNLDLLPNIDTPRRPNDTCPWKEA